MKYKKQEPAYVEHVKLLGNDSGTSGMIKVAIMLRINVSSVVYNYF